MGTASFSGVPVLRSGPQPVKRAPLPTTPLVSERPLRSSIQRAPLTVATGLGDEAEGDAAAATLSTGPKPASGAIDAPVRVHRGPTADQLAGALDARAFTHGDEVYLPSSHGPVGSGAARSLLAHELTHVVQQRRLGSALPGEQTPHGRALEAEAAAAERSSSLPLAITSSFGGAAMPTEGEPTEKPGGVQRASSPTAGKDETMTIRLASAIQRAPVDAKPADRPETPDRAPQKKTERELEDLARQLASRIGRRIQRDLLVDRERAGLVADLP